MIEIALEEFEEFYKERLNELFFKEKRTVTKLISNIKENLIEIKICLDHFIDAAEGKIDEKAEKSLHFFSDRIRKEIDDVYIPEEDINYDNITDLLNSIKKLFNSINEIARKSLPKFQKEVQPEIKELNYITRKLGKKQGILDNFLRKKYTPLREAENLLKKLPKLFTLKENIENAKLDMENLEKEYKKKEEIQQQLTSELLEIERDPLFKQLEQKKDELFKLRMKINDYLGFKKALKKLRFELEKGNLHLSNIDLNYLKEFLKDSIRTLTNEDKDLTKLTSLLVQLRHILEENKLNLKTETKEKTIEQINIIFDKKLIHDDMEKLRSLLVEIKKIEKDISNAGLAAKLEDVKNKVSSNTVKLEHLKSDLERKNKDYLRYLSSLKNEREEFQNLVSDVIGEDVKINITFSF
ncbi:MAG: coiled-coil domain-containing protein [Promethearchaeota archaeon]